MTTISADTHKYGYALKGTSVLCFADKALRNDQYFYLTDWSGGKYCSPGMDGSRSGGLLAATWAAMVHLGRSGYRRYAEQIFATSAAMQEAVREHSSLRLMGKPTFLFSFTSDEFDIYLVNDFLRLRGWRMNGQQYPNALHMAVTRPQTQPGVVERWRSDLADAVDYAPEHRDEAGEIGRHLRGRRGGHDRRGRQLHQVLHGRNDGSAVRRPVVMADAELCLSIDSEAAARRSRSSTLDGAIPRHEVHTWRPSSAMTAPRPKMRRSGGRSSSPRSRRFARDGELALAVKAVAVTGMYACTVPIDANGRPTGPCLTWLDTRGAPYAREAVGGWFQGYSPRKVLPLIRKTGGAPSTAGDDPVGQILYLEHDRPDVVAATRWYLEPIDYLTMRLTGVATATHASLLAWWITDNRHLDDYRYDEGLLSMMGLDAERCRRLSPSGRLWEQ